MKDNEKKIDEIIIAMRQLKKKCYELNIPMISVIAYNQSSGNSRDKIVAEMISPATVGYKAKSPVCERIFYDLSNLVTGNFKTVPIQHIEDEYNAEEQNIVSEDDDDDENDDWCE